MAARRKYRKRGEPVVAVRLALDTPGLRYHKWGNDQLGKAGDWLVDNEGDVYTVDVQSFANTYAEVSRGLYRKVAPVWAEQALASGAVQTKEGATAYEAGDYIVSNDESGRDVYAAPRQYFEATYEPADAEGAEAEEGRSDGFQKDGG